MRSAPTAKAARVLTNLADHFGYPACVLGGENKMHLVACNDELAAFVGVGADQLLGKHIAVLMEHFFRMTPPELLPDSRRRHEDLIAQGDAGSIQHVQSWFVADSRRSADVTIPRDLCFVFVLASRYPFKNDGRSDFLSLVQFVPRKYRPECLPALVSVFDHAGGHVCVSADDRRILDWFGDDVSRDVCDELRFFLDICRLDHDAVMAAGRAKGYRKLSAVCTQQQQQREMPDHYPTSASGIRNTLAACEAFFSKFPDEAWKDIPWDCRQLRVSARIGRNERWSVYGRLAFIYTETYFLHRP
jgi:hypothetical protein